MTSALLTRLVTSRDTLLSRPVLQRRRLAIGLVSGMPTEIAVPDLKPGDTVVCVCEADVWYKNVPGLVLSHTRFNTRVMISGEVLRLSPTQLKVVEGR